ncbi:MAG: glutathione S-transferase family protein [Alphaproteobacteria bacterium]
MSEIEIISSEICPYALRTRMALREKGVDFDLNVIDLNDKPDWFLKISPYGKVPVLRHGETVIFESSVINEYIEDIFPDHPLLPKDPADKARARIWIDFANVRFVPQLYKLLLAQEPEKQAVHAEKLTEALLMMERDGLSQSPGPYWLGDEVSLVDFTFLPHSLRLSVIEHYRDFRVPDECVKVREWLDLMGQRPSVTEIAPTKERVIQGWSKYAYDTGTGTTAADMREV